MKSLIKERLRSQTGAQVVTIEAIDADGNPILACPSNSLTTSKTAKSLIPLDARHIGRSVVLMNTDASQPLIVGLIHEQNFDQNAARSENNLHQKVLPNSVEGSTVELQSSTDLVLQCGESKIALTKAGKVLIEGLEIDISSDATNKVQGVKVEFN